MALRDGATGAALCCALVAACAAEASLLAFPVARVHGAIAKGDRRARRLLAFVAQPQQVMWAVHVLQGMALAGLLGWGAWVRHDEVADAGVRVSGPLRHLALLLVMTCGWAICRLVGQLLGRSYATSFAHLALVVATPLSVVLGPALRATLRLAAPLGLGPILRPGPWDMALQPGEPASACGPFWTAEAAAEVTHAAHHESMGERGPDLFASVAAFGDTIIREVMVPRTDVRSIPLTATEDEVRAAMRQAEHSRMPVYDETIDHVVGLLHVKALLNDVATQGKPFALASLLRPTFYVPEVMKISALLREFQRRQTHMAIVVDEYGGTSGIVTLEDIIEEIVGEIHDEYDVEDKQFRMLGEGKILADAKANIWDLEEALGVHFVADGEFETLGGFLLALLGSLPARGAVLHYENLRFVVKEANERRIRTVEIERRGKEK